MDADEYLATGRDRSHPLTWAFATGLLLVVALGAAYLAAHRAARVNPIAALR